MEIFIKEGTQKEQLKLYDLPEFFFVDDILVFVGYYIKDNGDEIFCYPKYMDDNLDKKIIKKHLQLVMKVIKKLYEEGHNAAFSFFGFSPENVGQKEEVIKRQDLERYIIKDYVENGIYSYENVQEGYKLNGSIKWNKTIGKVNPIIAGKQVFYEKTIKRSDINDNNFISQLHANIVNLCLKEQKSAGYFLNIKELDVIPLNNDYKKFKMEIYNALNDEFSERKIYLLRALLSWCNCFNTRYYDTVYGTTCFLNVWEWVNDFYWGNLKSKDSNNPLYYLGKDNKKFRGTGDLEPDTVFVDKKNNTIEIYDSKYYIIRSISLPISSKDEGFVLGLPQNREIEKQISYFKRIFAVLSLSKSANKVKLTNTFLIPTVLDVHLEKILEPEEFRDYCNNRPFEKNIGFVCPGEYSIDDFNELIFSMKEDESSKNIESENEDIKETIDKVIIKMINPEELYHRYLLGKSRIDYI